MPETITCLENVPDYVEIDASLPRLCAWCEDTTPHGPHDTFYAP